MKKLFLLFVLLTNFIFASSIECANDRISNSTEHIIIKNKSCNEIIIKKDSIIASIISQKNKDIDNYTISMKLLGVSDTLSIDKLNGTDIIKFKKFLFH